MIGRAELVRNAAGLAVKRKVILFVVLALGFVAVFLFIGLCDLGWHYERPSISTMVPMRDGIRLVTDVYLPRGEGPWPVVLVRTPYERDKAESVEWGFLKEHYARVVQSTRGCHGSEGANRFFRSEGGGLLKDGFDTCAWIVSQKWCNGKIGTIGASARGITQCLMALDRPPGLVCQVISFAPGDFYTDWAFPGGAVGGIWRKWLESQKLLWAFDEGLEHFPEKKWWERYDFVGKAPSFHLPALHVTGWFDFWNSGTIRRFLAWQENGGKGAKSNQWLVIGPWGHGVVRGNRVGSYDLPDNGALFHDSVISDFLAYWLRGENNGFDSYPRITQWEVTPPEEVGSGKWEHSQNVVQGYTRDLFLQGNSLLHFSCPEWGGTLQFDYDPRSPWLTFGGSSMMYDEGPQDISSELAKEHHLFFQTELLSEPLHVTGEVQMVLHAQVDAPSADLVAILLDIWPDGKKMILADGIKRNVWKSDAEIELPVVTQKGGIQFPLGWINYVFPPAHRLGLVLTGGNWPKYERNPQNGKVYYTDSTARPSNIGVHFGGSLASRLILPVTCP